MKLLTVNLKPGTIIAWSKPTLLQRLFGRFFTTERTADRFLLITDNSELLSFGSLLNDATIYEPIRKYNKQETNKLLALSSKNYDVGELEALMDTINLVRPNTFKKNMELDECRYYIKTKLNERADKYIY